MGNMCAGDTVPVEAEEAAPAVEAEPEPTPEPPVVWVVTIKKDKKKALGLDIKHAETALKVAAVKDAGLAKEWNEKNPDQAIQPGDKIVKVGATEGTSVQLLKEIKEAKGSLELTFERSSEASKPPETADEN
mmetsp:Transcript_100556/g.262130  ORF Transcript_100556/g.262130 Transcript_100556/m.262130 type:complete len:132 (-) Transcript_100556:118-513(-)